MPSWRLLPFAALVVAASCTTRYEAVIESDTEWSGFFGNRTVSGVGNATVRLEDDDRDQCCIVDKETEGGFLRIRLVEDEGWWDEESDWVETVAEFGTVFVCVEDIDD